MTNRTANPSDVTAKKSMYSRTLVFAAHSDDEITMAGTIAASVRAGCRVGMVTMTNGCEGYPDPAMRRTIVARRRREAHASDRVLGVSRHFFVAQPDMGLAYSKPLLQDLIRIIRQFRPEAIFTHGPVDGHTDHRMTNRLSEDAFWHAGQPVAARLGALWRTPVLYYYKGVGPGLDSLPVIALDVSATAYKRYEALATQTSQFTLFKSSRAALLAKARALKTRPETVRETFWLAGCNRFDGFPTFIATEQKTRPVKQGLMKKIEYSA